MNLIWTYLHDPAVQTWSSMLLHFLWQGFAIAGCLSVLLRQTKTKNAGQRYLLCLVAMLCMFAAPLLTWCVIEPAEPSISAMTFCEEASESNAISVEQAPAIVTPVSIIDTPHEIATVEMPADIETAPTQLTNTWAPRATLELNIEVFRASVFAIWLCVEMLLAGRLLLGAAVLWRIRRQAELVSSEVQTIAKRLSKQMGLSRVPLVLASERIRDASTYGVFRSVVLLPASWLTEMTPEMIEAVLAHELAHVRRYDSWVNLMQRLLEVLFFFHPAVWWLSRQLRVEREHRCDTEAVRVTGDPSLFAKTLELAARSRAGLELAFVSNLGDNQMSLLNRVNRVLDRPHHAPPVNHWQLGLLALLLPVLLVWGGSETTSLAEEEFIDFPVEPTPFFITDEGGPITVTPTPGVVAKPGGLVAGPDAQGNPGGVVTGPVAQGKPRIWHFTAVTKNPPTEANKLTLPSYVIEPPDILSIEGIRLIPKAPVKLKAQDVVQLVVAGTPPDAPIAGQYIIENQGEVVLGPTYGRVRLAGLTTTEAEEALVHYLKQYLAGPKASVSIFQSSGQQFLTGKHLVGPDGKVDLGMYGRVMLAGKTVEEGKRIVEQQLEQFFANPTVSLNVHVFNSKFYYAITETEGKGDAVHRVPVSGNETVLDAIALLGGFENVRQKKIWLSRPAKDRCNNLMPVDWNAITRGADTSTNFQLLPGDRLFISNRYPDDYPFDNESSRTIVEKFNRLVKAGEYAKAVQLAARLKETDANRETVRAIRSKAKDLDQNIAAIQKAEDEEVADLIADLKDSQLASAAIRKALRKKLPPMDFTNSTLDKAVQSIAQNLEIDITIDAVALEEEGYAKDSPVSLQLKNPVSGKDGLNLLLTPRRLAYKIDGSVVRVVSATVEEATLQSKVYYVADLTSDEEDLKKLQQLIIATVNTSTWDEVGGPSTAQTFSKNKLVISTVASVHKEIEELLKMLRQKEGRIPAAVPYE